MKFRKGDTVNLKAVLRFDCENDETQASLDIDGHYQAVWIDAKWLTLDRPMFLVGDAVSWQQDDNLAFGSVLAILDDHAWISYGDGNFCTRTLTSIARVEVSDDIA